MNTKTLIKIVLGLGAWSFLIIGLVKLQGRFGFATVGKDDSTPVAQPVLQKESEPVETTTTAPAITTKRAYPDDVLTDNRPGNSFRWFWK